jgi:AcrR family transcriptional regulator
MDVSLPAMSSAEARKTERRDEILAAALRVFAEKGYHDAGIADIAGVLGMGHGTFYRYYKNKHDIAVAVLDHVIVRMAAVGLREDPESSNTLEAYRAQTARILTGMIDLGESDPDLVRFFQMQGFVVDAARLSRAMDAFALFVARFLTTGAARASCARTWTWGPPRRRWWRSCSRGHAARWAARSPPSAGNGWTPACG